MGQDYLRDKSATALEVIEFYLDEELNDGSIYRSYYGMNVAKVLEIIRLPKTIVGVPGKRHEAAIGTFNLRDRVMPLVDLGVWLDKKVPDDGNRKVIVSEFSGIVTAFVVSGVMRIHRMSWAQVEPPGKYLQQFSNDSITGVVRFDERIVFLLDMEHIISTLNPSLSLENTAMKLGGDPQTGAGRKILISDDSPTIRKTISAVLTNTGYDVIQTTCGLEAWVMLNRWKKECEDNGAKMKDFVDLIISDIEMPEMDGHELTRRIKADPVLQKLPVVLFSSLISDVVKDAGIKAGADAQVSKPEIPQLAILIKDIIDKTTS